MVDLDALGPRGEAGATTRAAAAAAAAAAVRWFPGTTLASGGLIDARALSRQADQRDQPLPQAYAPGAWIMRHLASPALLV